MKSNIFIPKTINVGYQKRSDIYTGKLAYVIYYDEKGKLRKETSWNSWRDSKIPNEEFDNMPTSGFVLNKKVGDYDSGWNHRQAYTRIYDPRNFEFEITIENLLYILENTNSIKGKGLEGDFVYGWDGKDLMLIPTESPDYKSINEYNNILHNNETIKAKDLIVGATYLTKDNKEMVYMGKFDYFSSGYKWFESGEYKTSKSSKGIPTKRGRYGGIKSIDYKWINNYPYGKHFWFAYKYHEYDYIDGKRVTRPEYSWQFNQYSSISGKFIKCIDEKCNMEYSDIFEIMESSSSYSPYDESQDVFVEISLDDFIKLGEKTYSDRPNYYSSFKFISERTGFKETYLADSNNSNANEYCLKKFNPRDEENKNRYGFKVGFKEVEGFNRITLEKLYDEVRPFYKQRYLKNGKKYEKEYVV